MFENEIFMKTDIFHYFDGPKVILKGKTISTITNNEIILKLLFAIIIKSHCGNQQ